MITNIQKYHTNSTPPDPFSTANAFHSNFHHSPSGTHDELLSSLHVFIKKEIHEEKQEVPNTTITLDNIILLTIKSLKIANFISFIFSCRLL
jgi:hypothetical protein